MPLRVTTDHAVIGRELAPLVAADPVRHTIFGTMTLGLDDGAWLASWDGGAAARSGAAQPVALTALPGHDSPMLAGELAALLGALPDWTGLDGPAGAVRAVLAHAGRTVAAETPERLYRLDHLTEPDVPGRAVVAAAADVELVADWYRAFMFEAFRRAPRRDPRVAARALAASGCRLWLSPTGTPVAMAARRPVIAGSARIGPVYTPPEQRGHGYGSAVTAAATRSILDEGAVPVLFADLGNRTSNSIYQALGYRPVEDRLSVELS